MAHHASNTYTIFGRRCSKTALAKPSIADGAFFYCFNFSTFATKRHEKKLMYDLLIFISSSQDLQLRGSLQSMR